MQPTPSPGRWFTLARAALGTEEVPGPGSNPAIDAYFTDAGYPGYRDDTAWCAAFVGAILNRAGYASTGSLSARSYLNYGRELTEPEPGCLVVFWRESPDSWKGHVAFLIADEGDRVRVIGGNQANAVTVDTYPKKHVLGYRWPMKKEIPIMTAETPAPAKPATSSVTVWGGLTSAAGAIAMIANIFGVPLTAEMVSVLMSAVGVVMTLFGRLHASTPLGGIFKA